MPEEVFIDLTQESDDEAAPPPAPAEGGGASGGPGTEGKGQGAEPGELERLREENRALKQQLAVARGAPAATAPKAAARALQSGDENAPSPSGGPAPAPTATEPAEPELSQEELDALDAAVAQHVRRKSGQGTGKKRPPGAPGGSLPAPKHPRPAVAAAVVKREAAVALLRAKFGKQDFRPLQWEACAALLAGNSAMVVFPTGSGKSLCYQLPALFLKGLTVVVSPLISLMKDQVDDLCGLGIAADKYNSQLSFEEMDAVKERVRTGVTKLLYLAPESLTKDSTLQMLAGPRAPKLSLLAIDEAHCISEWGHDFRPSYLRIPEFVAEAKPERILACTATATPQVAEEVCKSFGISTEEHLFRLSSHRPNLKLHVEVVTVCEHEQRALLLKHLGLHQRGGAAIVYCTRQRTAVELADFLSAAGKRAEPFHAGLASDKKKATQDWFTREPAPIVCATIAFGMGIDKSNVRLVVHYNLPKSLESYSQEVGRAGRDGAESNCVLLANPGADIPALRSSLWNGKTTRDAVAGVMRAVLWDEDGTLHAPGDEVGLSASSLGKAVDMSATTTDMLLAFLGIYAPVLKHRGHTYDKLKFLGSNREALMKFKCEDYWWKVYGPSAPSKLVEAVAAAVETKSKWAHLDVDALVSSLKRQGISLDKKQLARPIWGARGSLNLNVKGEGSKEVYCIAAQPDNFEATVDRMFQILEERKERGFARLDRVLAWLRTKSCMKAALVEYFDGTAGGVVCNRSCPFCTAGPLNLPERAECPLDDAAWSPFERWLEGLVDFVDVSWSADLVVRIALDFNSPFVSEVRKQLKKAQRHEDLKSFGMLDGAGAEDICLRAAGALRRLGLGSR